MQAYKWIALPALLLLAIAPPALAKDKSFGSLSVECFIGEAAAMVTVSPAILWPPNHKLADVVLSLSLSDPASGPVDVSLTVDGITHDQEASENEGGHGCGKPTAKQGADWAPTDFSSLTASGTLPADDPLLLEGIQLRRERCAKDGTRLYEISVMCCDDTPDVPVCDTVPVIVTVPKSRGKGP
jgi:hypothetical protein